MASFETDFQVKSYQKLQMEFHISVFFICLRKVLSFTLKFQLIKGIFQFIDYSSITCIFNGLAR